VVSVTDYCPNIGLLLGARYTIVTCLLYGLRRTLSERARPQMDCPQRPERRDTRYLLHLPVSLKVADKELHTRSENISLGGILLSSASLIPEGSTVEVAFGVASLPDTGTQSSVRGKVLRVQPKATGDFAVAIVFEHPFRDELQGLDSGSHR
jgi:PilZ domain